MKFLVILTVVLGSIGLNSVHATTYQQEGLKKNYGPYTETSLQICMSCFTSLQDVKKYAQNKQTNLCN